MSIDPNTVNRIKAEALREAVSTITQRIQATTPRTTLEANLDAGSLAVCSALRYMAHELDPNG